MTSRWLPVAVALVLATTLSARADKLKAKFLCSGVPSSAIAVTLKIDGTPTSVTWKGKNLPPSVDVWCGWVCALAGPDATGSCGSVSANGRWKYKQDLPAPAECFGLTPVVYLNNFQYQCATWIQ
jgi:hypothetical protein